MIKIDLTVNALIEQSDQMHGLKFRSYHSRKTWGFSCNGAGFLGPMAARPDSPVVDSRGQNRLSVLPPGSFPRFEPHWREL